MRKRRQIEMTVRVEEESGKNRQRVETKKEKIVGDWREVVERRD